MWQWDSEPILRHQRTLSKLALLVRSNILPEDDLFMVSGCDCMGVVIVVMVTDLQLVTMPQWMDLLPETTECHILSRWKGSNNHSVTTVVSLVVPGLDGVCQ